MGRPKGSVTSAERERLAEFNRTRKPRTGKGLVAPVFVRDGVPGKVCVRCLEWRPLEKFAKHATCAGGRRNQCTTCGGRDAYAKHPERMIAAARKYQAEHPEKTREIKRANNRRRHGRKAEGAGVSVAEYREIVAIFDGACAYCGEPADTVDHVIPLSRGGQHDPANLVPACRACNFEKHTKTFDEWVAHRARTKRG